MDGGRQAHFCCSKKLPPQIEHFIESVGLFTKFRCAPNKTGMHLTVASVDPQRSHVISSSIFKIIIVVVVLFRRPERVLELGTGYA